MRDIVAIREVNLQYIPTCEIIVDNFMKAISRESFEKYVKPLSLRRRC